jgi:hypothetical protein
MQPGLVKASRLIDPSDPPAGFSVEDILRGMVAPLVGTILQISGPASLTTAVRIAAVFQRHAPAPGAWVGDLQAIPFPPDLSDAGIDLQRLLICRAGSGEERMHAVDRLLRSGAFSLTVVDFGWDEQPDPGTLARFMRLCERDETTLTLVTPGAVAAASPAVRLHLRADLATAGDPLDGTVEVDVLRTRRVLKRGSLRGRFPAGVY